MWRSRDYLGFWAGDAISSLGSSMSAIGYPLLILFATGSVARAGIVTAADMAGGVVSTLWGGVLADRVSRKALLVVSPLLQAVAAAVVAGLVIHRYTPIGWLAVIAAAGGLAGGVRCAARTPAMRRIVPKEQMALASSQTQGRDMAAQLLGSPLGGLGFSMARWLPFGADAVSFLFSALGAALIRRPLGPDRAEERPSLLADVRQGLRFVAVVPFLRFIALWAPAINLIAGAYFLLFIAILRYRGAGPFTIGLTSSIALIGGITGAVVGPMILRRVRVKILFLAGGWVFAVAAVLTAVLPVPWEIGCAVFVVMFTVVPLNAALESYQVRLVPDEFSGRVSAVVSFGALAVQWVGPLVAGVLADALGPPSATLLVAGSIIPVAVAGHLARSLDLLNTPVTEVKEVPVTYVP